MQYIALIYDVESDKHDPDLIKAYGEFTQEMISRGIFKAGEALQPVATATTVSVRDDKVSVKDGPFAETREQLGGYYLLECEDLDMAIECASKIPTAKTGRIEVRPVIVFG